MKERASLQLGMNYGTATNRLKKKVIFYLLVRLKENICFRCNNVIKNELELSFDHKKGWLDNGADLFWDLDNIGFSHHKCNCLAKRYWNKDKVADHGTKARYRHHRCRCKDCTQANTEECLRVRRNKKSLIGGTAYTNALKAFT